MLVPAITGTGVAEFVTYKSAESPTTTVAEALLLPPLGSPVVDETVSVCVMIVPDATVLLTVTTKVKFAVVLAASVAMVHCRVATVQVQPAEPVSVCAVVFAGSDSRSLTVLALAGPAFITVWVYVMLLPAVTGFGLAELVALRSACPAPATPMLTVAELSFGLVSCVVEAAVAVSVMIVPATVPALTFTITGNVLLAPGTMLGLVQLIDGDVMHVHPAGTGLSDTNVVLAGMDSVKVALRQLLGPPLLTVCV